MELWDLYTENRVKTGETHIRGDALPKDKYHLVVHVWIKNSDGKYLISQRSENRPSNPLKYECVGGSVLKDESSIDGAIRKVKEEVGIDLTSEMGKFIFSEVRKIIDGKVFNDIRDVWLFKYDGEINLKNATTDEVKEAKWMTVDEIYKLYNTGMMVSNSTKVFDKVVAYSEEHQNDY